MTHEKRTKQRNMEYNYRSKNVGKDLIFATRLRLAEKKGLQLKKVGVKMYSYLMNAELGIIL